MAIAKYNLLNKNTCYFVAGIFIILIDIVVYTA